MMDDSRGLKELVADLDEDAVLALVEQRIEAQDDLLGIINACNEGMLKVGERYESGEYYIAGLIMAGEIFRQVVDRVQPLLEEPAREAASGRILIGTVYGDIHDLGKNMFGMLLAVHGFEVVDLGIDVPPADFAARVVEVRPDVVGLSGLITASFKTMRETIELLRHQAQQHSLSFPILIGGGFVDDHICKNVAADYWAPDAMQGVRLCERLLG